MRAITPKSEAISKLIATFETLPLDGIVNMLVTEVDSCGSPACHAGWYVVAKGTKERCLFIKGIAMINNDLGFYPIREDNLIKVLANVENLHPNNVIRWAEQNPYLWGNKNGRFMFSSAMAFGTSPLDLLSIKDIVDHWKGVLKRVKQREDELAILHENCVGLICGVKTYDTLLV